MVLKAVVDEGEAEAIALALEKNSLLIIDDLKEEKAGKKTRPKNHRHPRPPKNHEAEGPARRG